VHARFTSDEHAVVS
jgi:hypothetical protein